MEFKHIANEKAGFSKPAIIIISYSDTKIDLPANQTYFTSNDIGYLNKKLESKILLFPLPNFDSDILIQLVDSNETDSYKLMERFRKAGSKAFSAIKKFKSENIELVSYIENPFFATWLEGFALTSYTFEKYLTEKSDIKELNLEIFNPNISKEQIEVIKIVVESTFIARDLVNEPGSVLTAIELSNRIVKIGEDAGFYTEVFNKNKIESLKMGGLLAVNYGSIDPPTFNILEWKPKNAKNEKPIILVGKGLVFDTGGLSLKPTAGSMDHMKSDMGGSAAVIGAFNAIAKLKLPLHIIGLIPSTDNRPGQNAYYPGDVITMYDGSTVEVLNTDAEGRMILADALAYAKKYDPELVINLATLTGSAMLATGKHGIVSFFKTDENIKYDMKVAGFKVHERLVELPLWDEYFEMLKSDIADVKNIGGREAGAITAAKFLEKFTDYPFVHFDIAGTAFSFKGSDYLTNGGTGVGVRLLTNYLNQLSK